MYADIYIYIYDSIRANLRIITKNEGELTKIIVLIDNL